MLVLTHIVAAISSLMLTGLAYKTPSPARIRGALSLFVLTIASGTYLVIDLHAPMAQSCIAGLAYSSVALSGLMLAKHKLARSIVRADGRDS